MISSIDVYVQKQGMVLPPIPIFPQQPDENGGHQKNAGKDTCHPIVQYIQWILLSFSINIPPDHELRMHDAQQVRGDGESFPLWAITRLSSHRGSVVSQCSVGSIPLPCQPLGLTFSDGRQRHLLCAHLLSTEGWLFP